MSKNRTVTVNGQPYRMHRVASTGWIFVYSERTGRTYPVVRIANGAILVNQDPTVSGVTNEELANAWINER